MPSASDPGNGAPRAGGQAAGGASSEVAIAVRDLTIAYGDFVVMRNLDFTVKRGEIFVIMGGSGCGKSTLLRHMIGLNEPAKGEIWYGDENFTAAAPERREELLRRFGVLYQSGGLWSSMTLAENVGLPLGEFTDLTPAQIREVAVLKLSLVGLRGFEDYYPSQISGGMQKRGGLARAMALDPDVLFLDEPSAGLDPVSSHMLDELILELRASLRATIVVVTHELASIFAIADTCVYLDKETVTMTALGNPHELLRSCPDRNVRLFLTRGDENRADPAATGAAHG